MNNDNEQSCSAYLIDVQYHTKENLSRACSDIFEDLLRKSYDLDEPLATLPDKCSTETQTGSFELQNKKRNLQEISEYDYPPHLAYLTNVGFRDVLVCYGAVKNDSIRLIRITTPNTTYPMDAPISLKICWGSRTISKNL